MPAGPRSGSDVISARLAASGRRGYATTMVILLLQHKDGNPGQLVCERWEWRFLCTHFTATSIRPKFYFLRLLKFRVPDQLTISRLSPAHSPTLDKGTLGRIETPAHLFECEHF